MEVKINTTSVVHVSLDGQPGTTVRYSLKLAAADRSNPKRLANGSANGVNGATNGSINGAVNGSSADHGIANQSPWEISGVIDCEHGESNALVTKTTNTTPETKSAKNEPVKGLLRYVPAGHMPASNPDKFQLPALSELRDERHLALHSVRPIPTIQELKYWTQHVQLHTHGFTAVQNPISLTRAPFTPDSFKSPHLIKKHLIPATADMLKKVTGCKTVITDAFLLRAALFTEKDSLAVHDNQEEQPTDLGETFPQFIGFDPVQGGASPASKIHLDYSPKGARAHLRYYHPYTTEAAAEIIDHEDKLLAAGKDLREAYKKSGGPRWALYSIWRPLKTVKRDPLAVADNKTFSDEDYMPVNIKTPRLGLPGKKEENFPSECYMARHSEEHKWYWIDSQTSDEILILKFFDSNDERIDSVSGGGVFHSSVDLPGTENEEIRESLETRALCIW